MRETLYLRPTPAHGNAQFETCVAPAEAQQSWPVIQQPLRALGALAAGKRVVLLWPCAQTRIDLLDIPVRHHSKAVLPARFALEESLAEDADQLHMVVAPRTAEGFPILSVQRSQFEAAIAALAEAGARPEVVIPEMLGLPAPEPGAAHALLDADQLMVRHHHWGAFQCDVADAEAALALLDDARPSALTVLIVGQPGGDLSRWLPESQFRPGFGSGLAALLPHLHPQLPALAALNLVQGPYAPQNHLGAALRPWRWPAALAASLLLLMGADHAVTAHQLNREADTLEAANVERFRALFPDQTRIVDIEAQAEQQLAQLRGSAQAQTFLQLLAPFSGALQSTDGLQLQNIQFREDLMQVGLTGTSLQPLERLRQKLDALDGMQYSVESADAAADGAQIRLRLQRRRGAGT